MYRSTLIALTLLLTGCASLDKSILLGSAIGGVTGFATGTMTGNQTAGVAGGIVLGSIVSYVVHKKKQRQEKEKLEKVVDSFYPKLKKPEVRKIWVPDEISGDEFISGHWKFTIQNGSTWTKED